MQQETILYCTTLGLYSFIDDKVTVVSVLPPLVAMDISEFVVGNDVKEDSDTAKDGGRISPATAVAICAMSSCESVAGNNAKVVTGGSPWPTMPCWTLVLPGPSNTIHTQKEKSTSKRYHTLCSDVQVPAK